MGKIYISDVFVVVSCYFWN